MYRKISKEEMTLRIKKEDLIDDYYILSEKEFVEKYNITTYYRRKLAKAFNLQKKTGRPFSKRFKIVIY